MNLIRSLSVLLSLAVLTPCISWGVQNEFPAQEISSNVPQSMIIAHLPITSLGKARVRDDLKDSIRTQEVAYAWCWIENTLRPEILAGLNEKDLRCLSGLGENKDDGVIASWMLDGSQYSIVDSRVLTLSVRRPKESKEDVSQVFQKVTSFDRWCNANPKIQCEELSPKDGQKRWGRILVDRGGATMWYDLPIEWYQDGDVTIFAFEKVLKHPTSKGFMRDVTRIVGGSSVDDKRPYLLFENNNRKELAEDFAAKLKLKEKWMNEHSNLWSQTTVLNSDVTPTNIPSRSPQK